jgi:hypothetical protein
MNADQRHDRTEDKRRNRHKEAQETQKNAEELSSKQALVLDFLLWLLCFFVANPSSALF